VAGGEGFESSTSNLGGWCFTRGRASRKTAEGGKIFMANNAFLYLQITRVLVMCMSNITVRVPEELKDRMQRCKNINWSEVARKAFEEAARREEIQGAAAAIDKLRVESKIKWDGTKEIRKWRDAEK